MRSRRAGSMRLGGRAALAAGLLAVTAGCSGGSTPGSPQPAIGSSGPGPTARAVVQPVPEGTVRRLPGGVFYVLAGTELSSMNIWEITAAGERQLTHNRPGFGIDSFAASPAGLIMADAQGGVDNLARWTSHGPSWLRPADHPREQIHGASPDIRNDGAIVYETPPGPGDRDFAVWFQRGFRGTARIIYRRRIDVGNPLFGPHDQIALWGPVGPYLSGHKPQVVILSGLAHPRTLHTGYSELGNPALWNEHAPALEVPSPHDGAKLFFPGGRQESLPSGWQPLAWNPAGSAMLLRSGADLGLWTLKAGHEVTMLGPISHGFQISQISWLSSPARL